ncbi:hypothetical protein GSI_01193 [Ganoderma sinense ZZ0214-1]|uniref:Uncharacterized protein n=1 Tax=Ganoderma sinense ZZ0214-1 TaxID=1077348 RepID=A0A2G8SUP5_9APHY|nr:hypothetical protein GSI_01193 [Ganoderma sinense ZZ0214-1]
MSADASLRVFACHSPPTAWNSCEGTRGEPPREAPAPNFTRGCLAAADRAAPHVIAIRGGQL